MARRNPGGLPPPNPEHATRQSLLARIKDRDERAWNDLVYIYSPLVYHVCNRWQVRDADADDIVQEVFQAVSGNIEQFEREREGAVRTFRSWLGGIIRNKLSDFFRRRGKHPQSPGGDDAYERLQELSAPEPAAEVEDPAAVQGVCRRALELIRDEFAEQTWQAFWRTAVDGQNATDIAAELGMTSAAVRKAKSRVLHRLKIVLGDVEE